MLAETLVYTHGEPECRLAAVRRVAQEDAAAVPSCGVLTQSFYIGAEGMVAPCMGMGDCDFADRFPNLFQTPLREILRDSEFLTLCSATVQDVRDHNSKCRTCPYVDRCAGGCRNSVLMQGDDYYGVDEDLCHFFENGWEERLTRAMEEPFRRYFSATRRRRGPRRHKTKVKPKKSAHKGCPKVWSAERVAAQRRQRG